MENKGMQEQKRLVENNLRKKEKQLVSLKYYLQEWREISECHYLLYLERQSSMASI